MLLCDNFRAPEPSAWFSTSCLVSATPSSNQSQELPDLEQSQEGLSKTAILADSDRRHALATTLAKSMSSDVLSPPVAF